MLVLAIEQVVDVNFHGETPAIVFLMAKRKFL